MISQKVLQIIEYDKIAYELSKYAVLEATKEELISFVPFSNLNEVNNLLNKTDEAYKYLYTYNVGRINYFSNILEQLKRVEAGGVLNNLELLEVSSNLKSARIIKNAVFSINDEKLLLIKQIVERLFINPDFEKEIAEKIISEDEISDNASPRLYSIRKNIRSINAKIRAQLNSYIRGGNNKFIQDNVITMRQNRYVIPVKSEYRNQIKGFIHDQSSSGSTVFIEPEQVMELNNDLKKALFDETEEIHKILAELSKKVSYMAEALKYNTENLVEIDGCFARAEFSYNNKCTRPILNNNGIINIHNGRHPLINKDKVVPVSFTLGKDYNFLLITGPNTGGKTVTLKLCGLLTLMAMSGLYIPADDGSHISVFSNVFCDIGDEQSIEQNLSTFSSHIKNIINIVNNVDGKSLVLLDELGAGTDPEEGSALALAIIKDLLKKNCFGIITTHYARLKEYAVESSKIENASMEFDATTLSPIYKLNIGIPGSSNALEIARTLGLDNDILKNAFDLLSDKQISFENVLKKAEESRRVSNKLSIELEHLKSLKTKELESIEIEKQRLIQEREKIYLNARQETKRIVAEKLAEAEEIIEQLKKILKSVNLESKELFRAGELKNRLKNSKYLTFNDDDIPYELKAVKIHELIIGNKVFVKSLGVNAKLYSISNNKKEAVVLIGDIKTVVKISDLFNSEKNDDKKNSIKIYKNSDIKSLPIAELNVIGKTSLEALQELEFFIDQAILSGLNEIKVIHGVGRGVLLKEIRNYLKTDKNVLEFRKGKYGEGENGVTIIKLK